LPAVVETDDGALMVVKFRGAGQGPRALVAEWIVGELARAAGLRVPAIARVELDGAFGRNEPDPEIRDLLRASAGPNLGLAYLPGAIAYDPIAPPEVDERTASAVVWLDAYVRNVDRSPRNPNLLLWDGGLWLIDHGAALYFHHAWDSARPPMPPGDRSCVRRSRAGCSMRCPTSGCPTTRWPAMPRTSGTPTATGSSAGSTRRRGS
jgi:hypothetical protein